MIAARTSLPEPASSVIASLRGERDIAALPGGGIPVEAAAIRFDIPVMVAAAEAFLNVRLLPTLKESRIAYDELADPGLDERSPATADVPPTESADHPGSNGIDDQIPHGIGLT